MSFGIDLTNARLKHRVELSEYHESLEGGAVEVWVNPNRDFFDAWTEMQAMVVEQGENIRQLQALHQAEDPDVGAISAQVEKVNLQNKRVNDEALRLYAQLWGVPVDTVQSLYDSPDTVGLYRWMTAKTWELINYYRDGRKKG